MVTFLADYSLSTQLNLEHVVLNGGHWLSTVTVFSQQLPPSAFCVGYGIIMPECGCFHKGQWKGYLLLEAFQSERVTS